METEVKTNQQYTGNADGVNISAPLVAVANSLAALTITGGDAQAGATAIVTDGTHTLRVTLDNDGAAVVSLLPFIRAAVASRMDFPLLYGSRSLAESTMRSSLTVTVTVGDTDAVALTIYTLYGDCPPRERVTDIYRDYDAGGDTVVGADLVSNYDVSHAPTERFIDSNIVLNKYLQPQPTEDVTIDLDVASFYGEQIVFSTVRYHLRYDCREEGVVRLRWLDALGALNTRKFTIGGRSTSAATAQSYRRPHDYKRVTRYNQAYYFGRDEWAVIDTAETLTIGDDAIPTEQFSWLQSLATSAAVEMLVGDVWTRVNIADASVECDPRRATFSATFSLIVPTFETQQF